MGEGIKVVPMVQPAWSCLACLFSIDDRFLGAFLVEVVYGLGVKRDPA